MTNHDRIAQAEEQAQMRMEYYAMEDRVAALDDERDQLREALEWYEKIVGECNRRGKEGEDARNALAQDVGSRARKVLQEDRDD